MPSDIQLHVADFDDEGPIFYDHETRTLQGSQYDKARKLLALDLIKRTTESSFLIFPIPGYNKRTYTVEHSGASWKCNCQWNATKGRTCSHIIAANLFIKKEREGRV